MDKREEAIIILNGLADNPLLTDAQKDAIKLGIENIKININKGDKNETI